jgi:single-stranded DNA-specific DHH superfamily exonuclease
MTVYEKSNSVETVALNRFSKKEYKNVLSLTESIADRQKVAQELINYLCDKYHIERAFVKVVSRFQPHRACSGRLTSKILGSYTERAQIITIYNLTAIRKQTVSIKTFAGTLLHEFMHHYDLRYLKLGSTLHTAGFYKRISDLENKLN